jgi:origin recognition complex subunit 3
LTQLQQLLEEHEQEQGDNDPWMEQILTWQSQLATLAQANKEEMAKIKRKEKKLAGMMTYSGTNNDHHHDDHHMDESSTRRHTKTAEKVQENAIDQIRRKGTLTSKMTMEMADWFQAIFR